MAFLRHVKSRSPLLDEALRLRAMGLSVLPIGSDKKTTIRTWKPFQSAPAEDVLICRWFNNSNVTGLAIILGPVSGHLIARDFDNQAAYDLWKNAYPHLAQALPTVRTYRGVHVYARIRDCQFMEFADGELRAGGNHYVLAPPSRHPNGTDYRWVQRFELLDEVPWLTVQESGFGYEWQASPIGKQITPPQPENVTERTEDDRDNRGSQKTTEENRGHVKGRGASHRELFVVSTFVLKAINQTCPTESGVRNKSIFEFARHLKSRPEYTEADPRDLEDFVRLWWERARPYIVTKDFDETRTDFIRSWRKVKFPVGSGPFADALKRAQSRPFPKASERYVDPKRRLLVSLCRELQAVTPNAPFFLSCRTAGECLGIEYQSANRWMSLLCEDEILKLVDPGTRGVKGRAARYCYIASND